METDLDLLITQDVGVESQVTSPQQQQQPMLVPGSRSTTPIYINTETSKKGMFAIKVYNVVISKLLKKYGYVYWLLRLLSLFKQVKHYEVHIKITDALNPTEDSNRSIVNKPSPVEELQTKAYCTPVELSEADERMKRFYGMPC